MSYEIYRYIFIGAAILCGVMLVVSVLLFIFLKIPKVISDLTGATARKAIKNIREQNEKTGDKAYKVSAFNLERGKLTDKISMSGNVIQQARQQMYGMNTSKIATQNLVGQEGFEQTTVLETANETTVLEAMNETTVLEQPAGETTVLMEQTVGETSVLNENNPVDNSFVIEFDITYIHSDEVIA